MIKCGDNDPLRRGDFNAHRYEHHLRRVIFQFECWNFSSRIKWPYASRLGQYWLIFFHLRLAILYGELYPHGEPLTLHHTPSIMWRDLGFASNRVQTWSINQCLPRLTPRCLYSSSSFTFAVKALIQDTTILWPFFQVRTSKTTRSSHCILLSQITSVQKSHEVSLHDYRESWPKAVVGHNIISLIQIPRHPKTTNTLFYL